MTAIETNDRAPELTDEQIVRRVCDGEIELFELLMRRHNQRVYRAVRAVAHLADEAEDIMQQTYVSAFRALTQFEGRSTFATWLTRIAIREAGARNRRSAAFPRAASSAGQESSMIHVPETAPDPEQRAVASDLMRLVEAEIEVLPEIYRSVLILREVEELSTEETAECLEISTDVVKTRLHRARTMLRDALLRRAGTGLSQTFSFGSARCDAMVQAVMLQIREVRR